MSFGEGCESDTSGARVTDQDGRVLVIDPGALGQCRDRGLRDLRVVCEPEVLEAFNLREAGVDQPALLAAFGTFGHLGLKQRGEVGDRGLLLADRFVGQARKRRRALRCRWLERSNSPPGVVLVSSSTRCEKDRLGGRADRGATVTPVRRRLWARRPAEARTRPSCSTRTSISGWRICALRSSVKMPVKTRTGRARCRQSGERAG